MSLITLILGSALLFFIGKLLIINYLKDLIFLFQSKAILFILAILFIFANIKT